MTERPLPKRVPKEIADAQAETMTAAGIYYWAEEANLRNGKAMIIGPEGSPYAYCPLLFSVRLGDDYPFNPPVVQFLTCDQSTRFHPNLYINGKVCLSILGTWSGPKWSAVMNISTVLSSIQSLLDANPITNEPGFEKYGLDHPTAKDYAEFVQARLIELSVKDLLLWKFGKTPVGWLEFQEELDTIAPTLLSKLKAIVAEKAARTEKSYAIRPYSLSGTTRWKSVLQSLEAAGV